MASPTARKLRTFVPAKDFSASTAFYQALGFEMTYDSPDVREMTLGESQFLLQNYYEKTWADNFMFQLVVDDLDGWWAHICEAKLVERFEGVKAKPPEEYPWGLREIHLIDPAGVLWHIVQYR